MKNTNTEQVNKQCYGLDQCFFSVFPHAPADNLDGENETNVVRRRANPQVRVYVADWDAGHENRKYAGLPLVSKCNDHGKTENIVSVVGVYEELLI